MDTIPPVSSISGEIQMTNISGSESHNNQRSDFGLLDSVYCAALAGKIEVFKRCEKEINQIVTPNGNTVLHLYITNRPRRENKQETDDFVGGIIEMRPDLLWKANKEGETLLHFAARHGHADVVRFLLQECKKHCQDHDLESGTEPTRPVLEMVNEAKDAALHEAVRYNHLHVVKLLTEEDPSLAYESNSSGETPLYLAAERGFVKVVKQILRTCLSPTDGGPNGRTALHAAVLHNDQGKFILTNFNIKVKHILTN